MAMKSLLKIPSKHQKHSNLPLSVLTCRWMRVVTFCPRSRIQLPLFIRPPTRQRTNQNFLNTQDISHWLKSSIPSTMSSATQTTKIKDQGEGRAGEGEGEGDREGGGVKVVAQAQVVWFFLGGQEQLEGTAKEM